MSNDVPPILGGKVPQARPGWPVAIGVICIIYAIAALTCSCSGLFTAKIYDGLLELDRQGGENDKVFQIQAEQVMKCLWAYLALSTAGLVNSAFLLIGAIALLGFRSWSRRTLMIWSIVEFGLIVIHSALETAVAARVANVLQQQGLQSSIESIWLEAIYTVAGVVVASSILPTFLLIWLSRAKIKQQIAAWE